MSARKATDKEALFFLTIIQCMKNSPEVDWDVVAERSGYSNGNTAKTRFSQIKKALGANGDAGALSSTKNGKNTAAQAKTTPKKIQKGTSSAKNGKVLPTPEDEDVKKAIIKHEYDTGTNLADEAEDELYEVVSDKDF